MTTSDDPIRSAQRLMRADPPKRFYRSAGVVPAEAGHAVALDGRIAKTPQRAPLVLPNARLAEAVAAEWRAQGETIDPVSMPLTRLVSVAIDGVAPEPGPVRAEIVKYAGSDLVCYRAGDPEGLVALQAAAWDPVIVWARVRLGARLVLVEGVTFAAQPQASLAAVAAHAGTLDPFTLAGLLAMTTLSGSALIAAMVADGALSAEAAWAAAHVDEDWNIARWGADAEAAARRSAREREFEAAAALVALVRAG